MAIDPKILERVQKMLAKETSLREIGTEAALNEAANAASMVAELMFRHKISLGELELLNSEVGDPIDREVYEYGRQDRYRARTRQAWEIQLAVAAAGAHDCRVLVGKGRIVFVGRSADRMVAMAMFRVLRREITLACDFGYKEARKAGKDTKGYIATFFFTGISVIQLRYQEMKVGLVRETDSSALVIRIGRDLEDWLDANVPKRPVKAKSRGSWSSLGATEGQAFGRNVGLDSKAVGDGSAEPTEG